MHYTNRDISIILVTYNSGHIIGDCFARLPADCSVIVVDNASEDDALQKLGEVDRDHALIKNERNVGYGAGNNVGLRQCKTRYAFIMNPDSVISDDDLRKLRDALEADDRAVLAGPLLLPEFSNKRKARRGILMNSCPKADDDGQICRLILRNQFIDKRKIEDLEATYEAGFLWGGGVLYDLQKMPEPIYFDENIFMYGDELPFATDIRRAGYKVLHVCSARARHLNIKSRHFNRRDEAYFSYYHDGRSKAYTSRKYGASDYDIFWHLFKKRVRMWCNKLIGNRQDSKALRAYIRGFQSYKHSTFKK